MKWLFRPCLTGIPNDGIPNDRIPNNGMSSNYITYNIVMGTPSMADRNTQLGNAQ